MDTNLEVGLARKSRENSHSCISCGGNDCVNLLSAPDRYHGQTKLYRLIRCSACFLVWLDSPPSQAEMHQHYSAEYNWSVAAAGEDPNRWLGRYEVLRRHKTGGSILDLGCSAGGFLMGLKGTSWQLHGIEMSGDEGEKARQCTGANVFVGDIVGAPFRPASFDVITCFHVFEHLYEPVEVLNAVYSWLKPEGIFYAMVPNIDSAGFEIFRSYWYALELPRHLYHYSPSSLRTMAAAAGLEEVSISTHREPFIESSVRYLVDDALRRFGVPRRPLAEAPKPSLPFRVARKAFRLSILPVLNELVALAGEGESIHAVFRKGTGALSGRVGQ